MSRPGSRPGSRNGRMTSSSPLNDVVRRSRALTNSIINHGSRSSSHDRGRRSSISNEYKRRSISLDRATRFDDMIAQAGGVPRATKIRRWDGNCRTTTNWDCLRKDPELWFSNGDCLVHFYGEHDPRRGASLRLWLSDIQSSNCFRLLHKLILRPHRGIMHASESDMSNLHGVSEPTPSYDLFIPAPPGVIYEEATNYHLTSRNFFAWMFEKPVVGIRLGDTLVDLLDRMNEWRHDPDENEDDFLTYIDAQGYTDFRDSPDHALAVLHWAEAFKHNDLWIDAFVHCAGMNEQLVSSKELNNISLTTKAMITRAALDMAVRLDKASATLADFCENDNVFNQRLRLSDSSLQHLERFRGFLQGFYVQRHGYWPPHVIKSKRGHIRPLPKHTLLTMYSDFRNLYEFMVNADADPFIQPEISRSVVDVLTTFDETMKFTPLPHLIPHLPLADFDQHELRRSKSTFSLFRSNKKNSTRRATVASALTAATNTYDIKVISSHIVREYALFERDYTLHEVERITATEARMARWVLVYAILQILISVTHAADEVRDVEGVDYPLCAQTAGGPSWKLQLPRQRPERRDKKRESKESKIKRDTSRRRSRSMHSMRRSAATGVDVFDYERIKSTASPPTMSPPTRSRASISGPPPPLPPPKPTTRAPSRAEQQAARERSTSRLSRLPVPVARSITPVSRPSRIPVPVQRLVSSRSSPALGDDIPPVPTLPAAETLDMPEEPEAELEELDIEPETTAFVETIPEPITEPTLEISAVAPEVPAESEQAVPEAIVETIPPVPLIPNDIVRTDSPSIPPRSTRRPSPPEVITSTTLIMPPEIGTPPPLSAKSDRRKTVIHVGRGQKSPITLPMQDHSGDEMNEQEAGSSPSVSPVSDTEEYFGPGESITVIQPTPRSSVPSANAATQAPVVQGAPRGRALTRSSGRHSRNDSSLSSINSSGTEHHTTTSRITSPSLYTPSHFGERFLKSRQSNPSTPLDQGFFQQDIPPMPATPSSPHSLACPTGTSVYTTAPEYPSLMAADAYHEDDQDEYESLGAFVSKFPRISSLPKHHQGSSQILYSHPETDSPISPSEDNAYIGGPIATVSLHRPSGELLRHATADEAAPAPAIGTMRPPSRDLHDAGLGRRGRFFGKPTSPGGTLLARRQGKSLTSVIAGSIVHRPALSPRALQPPATPLSPASFVSCESGSAPAGSKISSRRPSHARQNSSELAKQFRDEIGWKRGAGWDQTVDDLLLGP